MSSSRESIRIIHTGDFHLGNRFSGLEGNNIEEQRRKDMYENMNYIADFTIKNKADIVLICGDIFHRPNPSSQDFVEFSRFVGRLVRENVHVIAIAGNHDRPKTRGAKSPIEGLIKAGVPNFYYIDRCPNDPIILEIEGKGLKVGIVAIPYIDPRVLESKGISERYEKIIENRIAILRERMENHNPDVKILMLHVMLREADLTKIKTLYVKERKISYNSLHEEYFDYVALGHVHKPQKIGKCIYYSGSIERMAFDEENEEKSFNFVEISPNGEINVRTVKLKCRKMITKSIKVENMTISKFKEILRNMDIERGALLRIRVDASKEFLSLLDKHMAKIRNILLNEKKVLGFTIQKIARDIHTFTEVIAPEEIDIKSEILKYIDSLRIDVRVKKRAQKLALEILNEVGGS